MSDIVFILGAGASADCDAPLMWNFLDVAHDLFLSGGLPLDLRSDFKRVLDAIAALGAVHSKANLDTYNIETVFTTLELAQVLRRLPGFEPEEIAATIESLKTLIATTLEWSINFPVSNYEILGPKTYERFAQLLWRCAIDARPQRSVSIITFNYDVALDLALLRQNILPVYCLDEGNFAYPSKTRSQNCHIPVLKLHGSLNWSVSEETPLAVKPIDLECYLHPATRLFNPDSQSATKVRILPYVQSYFEKYCDTKVRPQPYIVPPTWNKADYHKPLSKVWESAAKHLSEALYIFVIGYSVPVTDAFFRQLYALGTAGGARLRYLGLYNPDHNGRVGRRFAKMIGTGVRSRYFPEKRNFDGAIPHIESILSK